MLTDIHLASKPVGLSMNLSKTKVMLNESATTSTVAVDGNTIEKVDRYVYLGKTVTQAGDLLPEIKRRFAVGWCDDVDNGLDNTCEVIRQETVLFSTPETDYIIYD